jgi:hypothetical protein
MSKFKSLSEKNMKFLLRRMYEDINNFGSTRDLISGVNQKILKDILDDIGMTVDNEDLSFIFSLYRLNPNYDTEPIKIPQLHTYEVYTKRHATISVRELWKSNVESYFEDENDVQDFDSWFGGTDWWEGEMVDREEYDEETTDTDYDEINKLS